MTGPQAETPLAASRPGPVEGPFGEGGRSGRRGHAYILAELGIPYSGHYGLAVQSSACSVCWRDPEASRLRSRRNVVHRPPPPANARRVDIDRREIEVESNGVYVCVCVCVCVRRARAHACMRARVRGGMRGDGLSAAREARRQGVGGIATSQFHNCWLLEMSMRGDWRHNGSKLLQPGLGL